MKLIFAKSIMLYIFCNLIVGLGAQEIADSLILYTPEFKFKEGVFPDFESVKRNSPIPKSRILTDKSYSSKDFFVEVLSERKLYFYDHLGNKLELLSRNVWGYARNGILYININDGFYRITLVGSVCHFVAFQTHQQYTNGYYSPYSNTAYLPTNTTTEMKQFLLDFKTGITMEYNVEGIEVILMNDPELYDDYMKLSRKKKKQLKFVYIRNYNERNPLYLLKN